MKTIQKIDRGCIIIKKNKYIIKTIFDMGKIRLTKKEISDIYGVKKSQIKKELNKILLNSNINLSKNIQYIYNKKKKKIEVFYSLDILLILGYNSKHFKETKFLVNTNNILKKYTYLRKHDSKKILPLFNIKSITII